MEIPRIINELLIYKETTEEEAREVLYEHSISDLESWRDAYVSIFLGTTKRQKWDRLKREDAVKAVWLITQVLNDKKLMRDI